MASRREQEVARQLERRLHEIYLSDAAMGPVGVVASIFFWYLLTRNTVVHDRLVIWAAAMGVVAVMMAASFLLPSWRDHCDRFGVPKMSKVTHLLAGIGWGMMLWIDIDMARSDPTLVWKVATVQTMITAAVMTSTNASGQLNYLVLAPMWVSTVLATAIVGESYVGLGCGLFVVILGKDMAPASTRVRELVTHQLISARALERDSLTGLLNRSGLAKRLTEAELPTVTAVFVDLDLFKQVNDEYGHEAGDLVLIEVGRRLEDVVRETDFVARLGGDEFVLVLSTADYGQDGMEQVLDRLIGEIQHPIDHTTGQAQVSASAGWARGEPGDDPADLLHRADLALRHAKRNGRQQAVSYRLISSEAASPTGHPHFSRDIG